MSKMRRGWIVAAALIALSGCEGSLTKSAAAPELREHYMNLDRLLEERDLSLAALEEKETDLTEWHMRQDSISAILYPDGPRPLISPFLEQISYNNALSVVDNLDREIASLRDEIDSLEAARRE